MDLIADTAAAARAADLARFLEARDSTDTPRHVGTLDLGIVAEPGRTVFQRFLGSTYRSLGDFVKQAEEIAIRSRPQNPSPGVAPVFLATWLPQAGRDLIVGLGPSGGPRLWLHQQGAGPVPVESDDLLLREIVPASLTRHAALIVNGAFVFDRGKGIELLREAMTAWPDYPPAWQVQGRLLKMAGDHPGARAALENAVRLAPEDADSHFFLGDVLDETPEKQRALEVYDRAAALGHRSPELFYQRGVLLAALGRADESWASYELSRSLDPHHAPTLANMAVRKYNTGDPTAAFALAEEIRPSDLRHGSPMWLAIRSFLSKVADATATEGAWLPAARVYEVSTAIDPQDAVAWQNWAICLAKLGATADALAKARHAVKLDPALRKQKLVAKLKKAVSRGVHEEILGVLQRRTVRYVDSRGRPSVMLNYIVKIETSTQWIETDARPLSIARDKDLTKLLIAKGHNARVERAAIAHPAFLSRVLLSRAAGSAPPEARPIVLRLAVEPEPDFVSLAEAPQWITKEGTKVKSAPVSIQIGKARWEATRPRGTRAFRLGRVLPLDEVADGDRFYPEPYAGDDD